MSFINRVNKVKEALEKLNLDGMYVTNLTNVRYLTGFTGSAGSVLILDNALSTKASGQGDLYFSNIFFSREPALTPILIEQL